MSRFAITADVAPGTILEVDGQKFHLVAVEPYTRTDGGASYIARWEAGCARCGDGYEVTTSLAGSAPARRCVPCRKIARGRIGKRGKPVTMRIIPA